MKPAASRTETLSHIGGWVRHWRTAQSLSLRELAGRAGVGRSTLSGWEKGDFQPRLPELEAVLHALSVSAEQQQQALRLLPASRAIRQLKTEAMAQSLLPEMQDTLPIAGRLLRALRLRQAWTLERAAHHLGCTPGTLSRWERGETQPASDHLERLLLLLGAEESECIAFTNGRLLLPPDLSEQHCSLDTLEAERWALIRRAFSGEQTGIDLGFFLLERALWAQAERQLAARLALASTWAHHAEWLMWEGRMQEASEYAERVLEMVRLHTDAIADWQGHCAGALHTAAHIARQRGAQDNPRRAVETLRVWMSFSTDTIWECSLYRDMATHATNAGMSEAAWQFANRACAAAERLDDPEALRACRNVRSLVLMGMQRFPEALRQFDAQEARVPISRLTEELQRTELWLALEEKDEAARHLTHAASLMETHGYTQFHSRIADLARSL
jgi:transcriptional regulator with XRE-family HTH domain